MISLIHAPTNSTLISNVIFADNFFSRLKGLMFSNHLGQDCALLIKPCQQIHTHFMRYPLDVIFVSANHKVVHIERNMKPWTFTKFFKDARYVLELNAGVASVVNVGDELVLRADGDH